MENRIQIDKSMLLTIVDIAKKAGSAILEVYNSNDFDIQIKGDDSPLTKADLASHQIIEAELKKHFPDIPCLSEESEDVTFEERRNWSSCFMVDPLDGTKEFIARNDEFTVNIALLINGKSKLGVVYAPVLGTVYYAATELGAFKQDDSGIEEQIKVRKLPKANGENHFTVVASRRHGFEAVELMCKNFDKYELTSRGSSLKMCLIAEGSADVYPRFAPTCEWDTAASQTIVEEAGGCLVNLDFSPLLYNQRDTLLNPYFLVLGDSKVDWKKVLVIPDFPPVSDS